MRRTMRAAELLVAAATLMIPLVTGCGPSDAAGSPAPTPPAANELPCGAPAADQLLDAYAGLTEDEATALAERQGLTVRVVGRDGECFAVTSDYSQSRVNLYVEDQVVVWAAVF